MHFERPSADYYVKLTQALKRVSHLTSLCQAHAQSEAGRHARGEWMGQAIAQRWVDHTQAFHHRLHDQLTGELLHTLNILINVPGRWGGDPNHADIDNK